MILVYLLSYIIIGTIIFRIIEKYYYEDIDEELYKALCIFWPIFILIYFISILYKLIKLIF